MPVEFSIIVPTFDRPARIADCLRALAQLDFPRARFEVIVVDDGSQVSLDPVIAELQDALDIALLKQPHAGQAAARNTGAASARGEFLTFTDDDCAPSPDWLTVLSCALARAPACAVGGRTINALDDNLFSTASQLLTSFLYARYNANANDARFFTTSNLAVPAERFRAVGGFDNSFVRVPSEDRFFCALWRHQGYGMIYAPDALVYHRHPLTWRTFWQQHWNYGRGAFYFHQARARRDIGRFWVEPPSFYSSLLRFPFAHAPGEKAVALIGLLVISQIANALGFLSTRIRHKFG